MVALMFGAIGVGSVISPYLTLTHTTREGANLASRGTPVDVTGPNNDVLDTIITAAGPHFRDQSGTVANNLLTRCPGSCGALYGGTIQIHGRHNSRWSDGSR